MNQMFGRGPMVIPVGIRPRIHQKVPKLLPPTTHEPVNLVFKKKLLCFID